MKKPLVTLVLTGALLATSVMAAAQQMGSATHAMADMHDAGPADAHGVGVVKAIDATQGTITLQHEAIASIHWPAMTMPFKLASPELLKHVKVGDRVRFTLRPDGMASMVTSIELAQPE
jgi:Cu(I)/Ag(I) efflux system protein CusF